MRKDTFPAYSEPCGWNALLPRREPAPRASGVISVKYAVIGAGFTGVAAARRLAELEPAADILLIEATTIGEGSSGRNSGFANPRDKTAGLSAEDIRRAEVLNRLTAEGFHWLVELIGAHAIPCELDEVGRITAAATPGGEDKVRSMIAGAAAQNIPHEVLDAAALKQRIGTGYYRLAHYTVEGYVLQPATLIRGLADSLPGNVRLAENSPLTGLERTGGKWRLATPEAQISADTVVLATNAAMRKLGFLRDRLVTIYTYAGLTEPMAAEDAAKLGAMPGWGLLPAHRLGTTLRRVGRDRFMVRSLYAHEHPLPHEHVREALTGCFHRRYPALSHVRLEHVWGGTTALTMNGSPFWGRLDEKLHTSAGCNGSGLVKGTLLGKRLAEHLARGDDQSELIEAYGTANWVAPEPFRSIGFHLVSAIQRRKAGAEM